MFANLYATAHSDIKDMISRARRYDDPETRLQMSEFERTQTASMMFVIPTILAGLIPTPIAWLLVPDISRLMGLPMSSSVLASPVIPVVIVFVLIWTYIGQRIMLRRPGFAHLAFATLVISIGAYGGWMFYLLKLKIDANPGFLG
jgi:hypothetical protein